jgi:putative Mg2+ transporter-C (MgtC) family protein
MFPQLSLQVGLLRLLLALVLGAAIGFERERGERAAGMRTHALVCLGAALIMLVSIYGFSDLPSDPNMRLDPSRIAAQVVAGIGFLGAGVILLREEVVKGLTTAAALWFVAGIGLACGAGLGVLALSATAMALVILVLLRPVERFFFPRVAAHRVRVRVEREAVAKEILGQIYAACVNAGVHIDELDLREAHAGDVVELRCRSRDRGELAAAVTAISALPGVVGVRADLREAHERVRQPLRGFWRRNWPRRRGAPDEQ